MKGRDNLIGIVLLGLCAVVIGALVWQIGSGDRLSFSGPDWLGAALAVIFFGAVVYGLYVAFVQDRGRTEWPNPSAGRRSLWDRLRGKND